MQLDLARSVTSAPIWRPADRLLVGAVYAVPERGLQGSGAAGDRAWVAAVTMDGARIVDAAIVEGRFGAPYEPGYLALRVGAVLEAAVRSLRIRPDVLLVNGTGLDHPRHAGLALHLGAMLDLPTIGVTDRTLSGGAGAREVRTNAHARPVWVHAGWETDLETACSVVAQGAGGNRTPEPLRQARQLARLARSRQSRAE